MSNQTRISEVTSSQQEPDREHRIMTFKATQFIWLLLGILEAVIALRIGLKLIGANPGSPIVALIYGLTNLFLFPFTGLVSSPTFGNMELEISSMFAMLIYGLHRLGRRAARVAGLLPPAGPRRGHHSDHDQRAPQHSVSPSWRPEWTIQLSHEGSGPAAILGLVTRFRMVGKILDWLAALFLLSDEQQEQAGIHLGRRRRS